MNGARTGGKNLQTVFPGDASKGACEIRAVSPSAPDNEQQALLCSSAPRKRMPFPRPIPSPLCVRASAPFSALPLPRPARPVGRKHRYRNLDTLKPWQVAMLHDADAVASQLGLPLNVFVTVYYGATFPGEAAMASTFQTAMKRMGQWLRDNGARFAWCFVHENPGDLKPNSHVLVHVPRGLRRAFTAKANDWFQALDGGVKVDPRNSAGKGTDTRLQYMTKGADDFTCRRYGGRRAKGGQGPIPFKRAGVAQCLRVGFRDQYAPVREAVAS